MLLPLLALLASPHAWTILPLGDSITAGGKDFRCYRPALARRLQEAGIDAVFVGSQGTELKHEGYPGKPVEFLAQNIDRWYRANPADIVLLHAGHNHFVEEAPIPGILRSTEQIIQTVRGINPKVIILVAQVIPAGKLPKYAYLPELNVELARLAARLNTSSQPVILVDQAMGFDIATDTVDDHVHPNEHGAGKMADRWFATLEPILRRQRE